jgi:hypothetical protein
MVPPGVKKVFEENTNWACAQLLAYEQIRQLEDASDPNELSKLKRRKR